MSRVRLSFALVLVSALARAEDVPGEAAPSNVEWEVAARAALLDI
jgi:hypothetical protein